MTTQDQPLWRVMQEAYCAADGTTSPPDALDAPLYAAEIEALRDRIVPEEPEPYSPHLPEFLRWRSLLWCGYNQRQYIRALLTTEAEKARRGE
jgi:hypothetical protein